MVWETHEVTRKKKQDPVPDRLKFGYELNQIEDQVREEMISEGFDPKDPKFFFEMCDRRTKRFHEGRKSYREVCADLNTKWAAQAALKFRAVSLNETETRYLIDLLFGINEPQGVDLRDKLVASLPLKETDNA